MIKHGKNGMLVDIFKSDDIASAAIDALCPILLIRALGQSSHLHRTSIAKAFAASANLLA
ncbi:hypothetical protein ACO0LM_06075 [Undibacterium sp. Di26W]|uniref:hypothetical protein n=1 Tax=Undibacterium sp. Di26W TaxID=3413035 RepID=UPI003BF0C7FF